MIANWLIGTEANYMQGLNQFDLPTNKSFKHSAPESVSVATTSVKILAETMAGMPLDVFNKSKDGKEKDKGSNIYDLLHYNPNPYTTSNTFFQTLEYHRNFTGNSFALIHRNTATGRPEKLEIINPSRIKGYKLVDDQVYYKIKSENKEEKDVHVNGDNMLHFKMMSRDGVMGIDPISVLKLNMGITYKGLGSMDSFYENNALSPKALKPVVGSASNATRNKEVIKEFANTYTGAANSGKWITLPPGVEIQDLAINFADAQIIESLKFNGQQIAALYGVPVYMATGDYTQSKFNNIEHSQLSFKVNTITPIVRMYRAELEAKLLTKKERGAGKSIEFNMNSLIEPDTKTKTDYYRTMTNVGAMSPFTVATLENLPTEDVQKVLLAQTNLQSLDKFKGQEDE